MKFGISEDGFAKLKFDVGLPQLYRSTNESVYNKTVNEGVLWLRTDQYLRDLEEEEISARADDEEGRIILSAFGDHGIGKIEPMREDAVAKMGWNTEKHYILSLHANNADIPKLYKRFSATHTFCIRNVIELSQEIVYELNRKFPYYSINSSVHQVTYLQYARAWQSEMNKNDSGEKEMNVYFVPSVSNAVNPIAVKHPYFGYQDEWRITVVFKDKKTGKSIYVDDDDKIIVAVNANNFTKLDNPNLWKLDAVATEEDKDEPESTPS